VLQNVNGQISNDGAQLKQGLIQQLYLPVLWTQSVEKLASSQIDIIVECGPGKVLSGLNKRIHAQASLFNLHKVEDFSNLHSALSAE
jgi:[acyl-carrier-protein] S-malonyltransferase